MRVEDIPHAQFRHPYEYERFIFPNLTVQLG